jgi:hypothetical protein
MLAVPTVLASRMFDGQLTDRMPDLLGDLAGALPRCIGRNSNDLLTTMACRCVHEAPEVLADATRDGLTPLSRWRS